MSCCECAQLVRLQLISSDHPSLWKGSTSEGTVTSSSKRYDFNPKLDPIYDLHNVVMQLRRAGYRDVIGIYGATTPIAKFKAGSLASGDEKECDLNVNDLGGW